MSPADYVSVIYNKKDKPFTPYPNQLAEYLVNRFELKKEAKLLDIGCGRGEFLRGFIRCGLKGYGVDQTLTAKKICPEAEILQFNLEATPLPYEEKCFDYIFSKSVIEHFYYPEKLVKEIHRLLKPGGLAITMTPDWEAVYKIFYEDYTHRTPFTRTSLRDIFQIHDFKEIKVEKFKQLPFLWENPWLEPLSAMIALLAPSALSLHSKLVRFSKERMLLASAIKLL